MELCVSAILYGAFVSHASSISEGFAGKSYTNTIIISAGKVKIFESTKFSLTKD